MRGNRKTDTRPEVAVRAALHAAGLRFRKEYPIRAGSRVVRVDVAFPRQRLAVFVDGCFWHMCPEHGVMPRRNVTYWRPKLRNNVDRDSRTDLALSEEGWAVVRIWEHATMPEAVGCVTGALGTNHSQGRS
ncbi:MAG: very short patch repair endonuclease [Actinomycetota bacterium]